MDWLYASCHATAASLHLLLKLFPSKPPMQAVTVQHHFLICSPTWSCFCTLSSCATPGPQVLLTAVCYSVCVQASLLQFSTILLLLPQQLLGAQLKGPQALHLLLGNAYLTCLVSHPRLLLIQEGSHLQATGNE